MIAPITLFEHEAVPFDWTDRELAALEVVNHAVGDEVLHATVRGRQRMLQARQWVGVVRFGKYTAQVLPKIYRTTTETSQQAREATHNLLYLLAYAGQLTVRESTLAPLCQRDADWFEILTYLFAVHLAEEWQRGAYRGYQTLEDELPVLKGKWRVAEHLRHPDRQQRFAVSYDEFTADNALNRVFRFVVERLWRLTRNTSNRRLLDELRQWMDEVALLPAVTVEQADPALLTRLNQRYAPLLHLARLFLDGGALQLVAGDLDTFALVFEMNQLFEAFLVNFIRRHRETILPRQWQECELLPQSHSARLYLAYTATRDVFQLKPDLVLRHQGDFPLLVDAKYKQLDQREAKLGVLPADFYQMYVYARRYACPRVLLLYPQTAEMSAPLYRRFGLQDSDGVIETATIDVRIALHLQTERQKLMDALKRIIGGTHDI